MKNDRAERHSDFLNAKPAFNLAAIKAECNRAKLNILRRVAKANGLWPTRREAKELLKVLDL